MRETVSARIKSIPVPRVARRGKRWFPSADRVISPYSLAGRRMALSALQPLMVDFFDVLTSGRPGEQLLGDAVRSHGGTKALERGVHSGCVRGGWPHEDVHVVGGSPMTVNGDGPSANEYEVDTALHKLAEQILVVDRQPEVSHAGVSQRPRQANRDGHVTPRCRLSGRLAKPVR